MKPFKLKEHPIFKYRYTIEYIAEPNKSCFPNGITGSTNVLISRLLGLTYPEYLTFARDVMHADLIGKGTVYITPVFPRSKLVRSFITLINLYMKRIINEHEHPVIIEEQPDGTYSITNMILE